MPWSPIPPCGRNPTVWDETGGRGPPARRAYASERNVAYGGDVNPPRNQKGGSGNPPDLIQKHACHGALLFCRDPENNRQNIGYCRQANLPVYFPISQYQANSPKNQLASSIEMQDYGYFTRRHLLSPLAYRMGY